MTTHRSYDAEFAGAFSLLTPITPVCTANFPYTYWRTITYEHLPSKLSKTAHFLVVKAELLALLDELTMILTRDEAHSLHSHERLVTRAEPCIERIDERMSIK